MERRMKCGTLEGKNVDEWLMMKLMFKLFPNTHSSNTNIAIATLEQHVHSSIQQHSISPHTHQIKIMLMQVLKAHNTYLSELPYVAAHSLLFVFDFPSLVSLLLDVYL